MKPLALPLILLGFLIGPGYWLVTQLFSGTVAALIDLVAHDQGRLAAEGIRLEPTLAPAALILVARAEFTPNRDDWDPPEDQYQGRLLRDGIEVQRFEFTLEAPTVSNPNPVFRTPMLRLDSTPAGSYSLEISPVTAPDMQLRQPQIELRSGVRETDMQIVSGGLTLMAIGFIALLF